MPDFKAISDALGAVKNLIDGAVAVFGSVNGTGTLDAFETAFASLGGGADAA
ncbi:hypothetical protein [Dietzia sp. B32]|uniref:hypothetical protein n=1 Tax=Dietzia sp. B32 TaxID=2915130 RepID=UPI0021AD88E3|nr:hypothetical protein [Dietzia sp. B32]UVE96577.1 hypothetical protein L8M95_07390 [Dietzia sp. B32]